MLRIVAHNSCQVASGGSHAPAAGSLSRKIGVGPGIIAAMDTVGMSVLAERP
jgi:hypothetical protein